MFGFFIINSRRTGANLQPQPNGIEALDPKSFIGGYIKQWIPVDIQRTLRAVLLRKLDKSASYVLAVHGSYFTSDSIENLQILENTHQM